MRILLDTHIWVWWMNQSSELSPSHNQMLENADEIFVSAISCWEVTQLSQRGRLILPLLEREWIQFALEPSGIGCLPLDHRIAIRAAELPYHHRDPADRFIIASALEHELQLMSFDQKFPTFQEIQPFLITEKLNKHP